MPAGLAQGITLLDDRFTDRALVAGGRHAIGG
jgi:hypothetical protein